MVCKVYFTEAIRKCPCFTLDDPMLTDLYLMDEFYLSCNMVLISKWREKKMAGFCNC